MTNENNGELLPDLTQPASVELVAAALRADAHDLDTYERVLVGSLSDSLPQGMIEITRDRSMSDRIAGRPGKVTAIQVNFGEVTLELVNRRSSLVGSVAKAVRGVIISRKEVSLDEWVQHFAKELLRVADEHAAARGALEKFLQGT
jgi:hypothetical protein